MSDVEKYAKEFIGLVGFYDEFKKKVDASCGGSFKWGIEQVIDSYLSLFDRFCPYKIGDRVKLNNDVKFKNNDHGWYSSRHFLIKDEKATVYSRGYSNNRFTFEIEFDNETWIDRDGNEKPVSSKHVFHFSEDAIDRI